MGIRVVVTLMFCISLTLNMTRSIAVLFALGLGAKTFEIGMLVALFSMFPIVFAIPAGKVADYLGERTPVLLGSLGMGIGMALPFAYPSLASLYASQLAVGIGQLFAVVAVQNLVGRQATDELREHHFGMFSTAVSLANVVGPVTGGFIAEHFSFPYTYLCAVAVSLVAFGFALFLPCGRPLKEVQEGPHLSSFTLLKLPLIRRALLSSALVLYSRDVFVTYFPLYAERYGLSVLTIGWIISIQGLSMVIVRSLLPQLTRRFGRDRVLIGSIGVAGVAFLLIPTTQSVALLAILGAFMGAGLGCGQPLSMVDTYNASPKSRTGEVLGLRMTANRVSQFAAPLFFGLVGASMGVLSIFLISGAFLLGGGYLVRPFKEPREQPGSPPDSA